MKTKEEQIKAVNESFEKCLKEIQERLEYRMKNYYDCVDDYSYGGICDKADDELEDKLRIKRDIIIEQIENDGKVVRKSSFYRLVSKTDMCDGARSGRYGEYFTIDGKFVGVPKKLDTLIKKGYKLYKVSRTYECTLKEVSEHGVKWRTMELVDEVIKEEKTMPQYVGVFPYIDYQYDAYFNNNKNNDNESK